MLKYLRNLRLSLNLSKEIYGKHLKKLWTSEEIMLL